MLAIALCAAAPAAGAGSARVLLGGTPFDLELAAEPAARALGLSGRRAIPERGGMLFVFPESKPRAFWMFRCFVDIGLVFLDESGRVVALHEMTVEAPRRTRESERDYQMRLRRYPSGAPARYAIEVRGGTLGALGLEVGQQVDLSAAPRNVE